MGCINKKSPNSSTTRSKGWVWLVRERRVGCSCGLFEVQVVSLTVIGRCGGWSFCHDTHIFVGSLIPTAAMSKFICAQAGHFLSRNPARHGIARYQVMLTASTSATSSGALFHEVWKLHWPHACIKSGAAVDPHQLFTAFEREV